MEELGENNIWEGKKGGKKTMGGGDRQVQNQKELDEAIFKDDIETDPEYRANFNLRPVSKAQQN